MIKQACVQYVQRPGYDLQNPLLHFLKYTNHKMHNQTVTIFLRTNKISDTIRVHVTKVVGEWLPLPFVTGRICLFLAWLDLRYLLPYRVLFLGLRLILSEFTVRKAFSRGREYKHRVNYHTTRRCTF